MTKYGFGDDDKSVEPLKKIPLKASNHNIDSKNLKPALQAGKAAGFVKRLQSTKLQPRGRRRKEPQDRILITGPARVIDTIRELALEKDAPYWEIIEDLLKIRSGQNKS